MNYYDHLYTGLIKAGTAAPTAIQWVAEAYLDGKPQAQGKRKVAKKERDSLFWVSQAIRDCEAADWASEVMVLALARYLGQQATEVVGLVEVVARASPDALIRATRYSGLVLHPSSPRRSELDCAAKSSTEIADLCRVLDQFGTAHRERVAEVKLRQLALADLSAFDLLSYASLYAFERLVPRNFEAVAVTPAHEAMHRTAWDAINELLKWKLETTSVSTLSLSEDAIGRSVQSHLGALLFDHDTPRLRDALRRRHGFDALMAAQIELGEFVVRSAEAFCHDDTVRFVQIDGRLEILEVDPEAQAAWRRCGRKLDRLHGYWFYRAMDDLVQSGMATATVGRPENADANQLAWLRARRTQLRLREVYGVEEAVATEGGETVNVFQALLSLELMSAFFLRDCLAEFAKHADRLGDWLAALRILAMDGMFNGRQNRFPLTWSDRQAKVAKITGWTVTPAQPQGSSRMAAAILDFWTYDMPAIAERLQRHEPGLQPQLLERPVLRFGTMLVQLPWILGLQNNSTAAINNLRRLGARRAQARAETQRIESNLAQLLEARGFMVVLNWAPPLGGNDAGEVDVIAVRDGHLFVLEVKSTYVRRTHREAWQHASTTLRKAGQQLRSKVAAVTVALDQESEFRARLGLTAHPLPTQVHGWIVDTSIECDHQRFAGFLKISVEEMMIALRDDQHHLNDPDGLLTGRSGNSEGPAPGESVPGSLYPRGFTAERFVDVIETEAVWADAPASHPSACPSTEGNAS